MMVSGSLFALGVFTLVGASVVFCTGIASPSTRRSYQKALGGHTWLILFGLTAPPASCVALLSLIPSAPRTIRAAVMLAQIVSISWATIMGINAAIPPQTQCGDQSCSYIAVVSIGVSSVYLAASVALVPALARSPNMPRIYTKESRRIRLEQTALFAEVHTRRERIAVACTIGLIPVFWLEGHHEAGVDFYAMPFRQALAHMWKVVRGAYLATSLVWFIGARRGVILVHTHLPVPTNTHM